MRVVMAEYCDRCGRRVAQGMGAEVHKRTVKGVSHPTRHLCERCYGAVFEKALEREFDARIAKGEAT